MDDDLLTRYLLGDSLPEQDESVLEDLLFKNDEYLEQLSILEDEVIESHIRRELPEKYEVLLRKRLNLSPRLRERVAWVGRHMSSVAVAGEPIGAALPGGPQGAISWWESAQRAWQRHHLSGAILAVAGLLALCAASVWILTGWNHSNELRRNLAEQRQVNRELTSQLESERTKRESLDRELAQVHGGPPLITAFLALTPADEVQTGQRRGTGRAAVELAPQAGVLQLQMTPRALKYAIYRGVIETVEGEEVVSQNGLVASNVNGNRYVVWNLSTAGLPANDYVVSLYGVSANGRRFLAGVFSFRLRKPSR